MFRAIVSTVVFVAILAALLLAVRGTLFYWQAWLWLACFGGSAMLLTVYLGLYEPRLLERRMSAGPAAEKRTIQCAIQTTAGTLFFAMFAISALDRRLGWSHPSAVIVIAGDVLVLAGFAIVWMAFKENEFAGGTISIDTDQHIVSSGVYGIVRHPMYSGALLLLLGTPLALGSFVGCVFWPLLCVAVVARTADEERMLSGSMVEYREYLTKVRYRLLPPIY